MKRDEALAPLSREHHATLILAQLLKKGAPAYRELPTEPWDRANYALEQFESDIKNHFAKEEAMLHKVQDCHADVSVLADEIRNDHSKIAALFASLTNAQDLVSTMDELGNTLQAHIRKEERALFPLLQEHCSPAQLAEIHDLLH